MDEQPAGALWVAERKSEVDAILSRYPQKRSAVLPLLHLAQEARGYLAPEDMRVVGELLEMTPSEVSGIASFYALLHHRPKGRYTITLCQNLSCVLAGAEGLSQHLQQRLGIKPGETTPDGLFTLEETHECLASCDGAPALQVNLAYYGRMTAEKVDRLLDELKAAATNGHSEEGGDQRGL
ncbi:NADH-quinone oxidoreductase subunit E [Limnochorda pilosa]|uniref:NADH-quinone oxidoreductase subunit E n=2 Tax=Limnochorda pilosa TaxID=1555112 RepID=A0A0K2SP79_LIMPI|nr:NADH-quinone oxidoreductase subunit E [Limnochorda pilosa]